MPGGRPSPFVLVEPGIWRGKRDRGSCVQQGTPVCSLDLGPGAQGKTRSARGREGARWDWGQEAQRPRSKSEVQGGVNVALLAERGMDGEDRCRGLQQGLGLPEARPRRRDGGRGEHLTG
jgi:hypothetical protein